MMGRDDDPYEYISKLEVLLRRKDDEITKLIRENKQLKERLEKTDVAAKDAYILKLTNEINQLKNKKALANIFEP